MTSVFCIQCESSLSETKAKDPGRKLCSVPVNHSVGFLLEKSHKGDCYAVSMNLLSTIWKTSLKILSLDHFAGPEVTLSAPLNASFCYLPSQDSEPFNWPRRVFCKGERTSWQSVSFEISKFMWLSEECVSEPEKESKLLHSQAAGQTSTETLKNTSRPQELSGLLGKKRLLT